MTEQTMKILQMLEDGKITVEEANRLISTVQDLEEQEAQPGPRHQHGRPGPGPQIPHVGNIPIPPMPSIPPMPDINRIVNDALHEAFQGVGFHQQVGPEAAEEDQATLFRGGRFAGARLEHTDLTDAKLDENTRLEGADMRYASFVDADLRGADLRGTNLSYSAFVDAKFQGVNLQGANLSYGSYVDADFRNANLQGADLSYSDFTDADFKNVREPGLRLRGVAMPGVRYETSGTGAAGAPEHAEAQAAAEPGEAGAPPQGWEQEVEVDEPQYEAWNHEAEENEPPDEG